MTEFFYVCRYCKIESDNGFQWSGLTPTSTGNIPQYCLNAICPTCSNIHWNELYEHKYRKKYLNDENLEKFISLKGYSLEKNALFDKFPHFNSLDDYAAFFMSVWGLTYAAPSNKKMLFVTLNPKNRKSQDILELEKTINHILKTSNITDYVYAIEWSNPDEEDGLHCHLLLQGNISKITQHITKRVQPNFNGFIHGPSKRDPRNPTAPPRPIPNDFKCPAEWWDDKIAYISGDTKDELKNEKKQKYKALREKYNLDSIYRK